MEKWPKFEYNKAIDQLLTILEKERPDIKKTLLDRFNGVSISAEQEEEVYKYFLNNSIISTATMTNPGTSVITEFLYNGSPISPFPIDNYFLQSEGGKAIKARLIAVEEKTPKIIDEYRKKSEVLIYNLGSGPGRDIIDILYNNYKDSSNIKAIHIDRDPTALKRGKRMASVKQVDHLIDFIEANFWKYNPQKKSDVVLLIGILCGLEYNVCIKVLGAIRKFIKKDGCLIASNVSKKMLEKDPFTCFLMEWVGNWKLVFKDQEELKHIFEKSGYKWKGYFTDSYGFHIMGIGTPRPYF